ncbi:hypothetical protein BH24GEM1_BH24GEM1_30020 [soil metagenome]
MRARMVGALSCLLLSVSAGPAKGQDRHLATQVGDTVNVIVHKVRADKRAQYDSLMQTVWWPAMKQAGKKNAAYAKYAGQRRRYVPAEMEADSTYTYLYLYFGNIELPEPRDGGNRVLRLAGLSKAQSDSFTQTLRSCLAASAGGPLIDEPYR